MHAGKIARQYVKLYMHLCESAPDTGLIIPNSTDEETEKRLG